MNAYSFSHCMSCMPCVNSKCRYIFRPFVYVCGECRKEYDTKAQAERCCQLIGTGHPDFDKHVLMEP